MFCSGESEFLAKHLEQAVMNGKCDMMYFTIDLQGAGGLFLRHVPPIGDYWCVDTPKSAGREGPGTSCQVPMMRLFESTRTTLGL